MYELKFQGRVLARGSKDAMRRDLIATVNFTGRDYSQYKIEKVG